MASIRTNLGALVGFTLGVLVGFTLGVLVGFTLGALVGFTRYRHQSTFAGLAW